jgi:periplasmic protein CpxP/Spy
MKRLLLILTTAALSALGFYALAQTAPHHGSGDPIAMIQTLHDQLGLDMSQQPQWDAALAATQSARQAMQAGMQQLKAATQAELAKAEPDLASLAAQADAIHQQNAATRKAARDAWLTLYASLNATQKGIVRDAIAAKLARFEEFRARMLQRLTQ